MVSVPMKTLLLPALLSLAFLTGCGQKEASAPEAPASSGPREIDLTAGDTMKFNTTTIVASPGEALDVVLTNIGTVPVEVMGHNWILLKAGSDALAFSNAAQGAKDTGYIPPSLKDEIIAHIDLLGPRKSGEVRFNAPTVPGSYPFLCSFPGHCAAGMKGTLVVR
jgi:azurin